jgi:shikimate dehydrogenase
MQNAAFAALNLNCVYIAFRVPATELAESVASLRASGIAGFNITIPHKVAVVKYLDALDDSAKSAGAVNTVKSNSGAFTGYNTDIDGFIKPLHARQVDFSGMRILLLGAGGAARAVVASLSREQKIAELAIANRDPDKAEKLAEFGSNSGLRTTTLSLQQAGLMARNSDLIVNATSIGLKNEKSLIEAQDIRKGSIVYDIVYRPVTTSLLENAKKAQAIVVYGYEMLIEQGALAFEIWTGLTAPRSVMKKNLLGIFGEPA